MGSVVLDGGGYVEGEGAVLGLNLRRHFATRLLPNYFGQYLLNVWGAKRGNK